MKETDHRLIHSLMQKIGELSLHIEKMKLAEYVKLLDDLPRLLWINFLSGIARGLGMAVGFTVLGALLVYILSRMVDLPLIGSFIAEIVRLVEFQLGG